MAKNQVLRTVRNRSGQSMIEMMAGLLVCTMVMAAMISDMTSLSNMGEQGEQQFVAATLCQETVDNVRNLNWSTLTGYTPGTYSLVVNQTGTSTLPGVCPRPLMLDTNTFNYNVKVNNKTINYKNYFPGTVSLTLSYPANDISRVQVDVDVAWSIRGGKTSTGATFQRHFKSSTIVSQYGVHQ